MCRGPTQEEIEKKLLEQMDERFHVAQHQLREELTRKVWLSMEESYGLRLWYTRVGSSERCGGGNYTYPQS